MAVVSRTGLRRFLAYSERNIRADSMMLEYGSAVAKLAKNCDPYLVTSLPAKLQWPIKFDRYLEFRQLNRTLSLSRQITEKFVTAIEKYKAEYKSYD